MRMMSFKKKMKKKLAKREARFKKRIKKISNRKRTDAEVWAEGIILKKFSQRSFIAEYKFKFRRFDFYFFKSRCALEIDGEYHLKDLQKSYDTDVDNFLLKTHNIKVFRAKNFDESTLIRHLNDIALIENNLTMYSSKKIIKINNMNDKTIGRKIKTRKAFEESKTVNFASPQQK